MILRLLDRLPDAPWALVVVTISLSPVFVVIGLMAAVAK